MIFAVVKFTEGAWLVVILFPLGWLLLIRLNRQYRREAHSLDLVTSASEDGRLPMHYARHVVLVFVDRLDLAVLRTLRYAGTLRPTEIRAVHVMLDDVKAHELERSWIERGLGDWARLEVVECPDRRLLRSASEIALDTVMQERAEVTVLLPRRTFRRLSQRLLHDRSADRMAAALGRIPHVAATIVPFDTTLPLEAEERLEAGQKLAAANPALGSVNSRMVAMGPPPPVRESDGRDLTPIGAVSVRQRVTIEGRIRAVQIGTIAGKSLEAQVFDETGGVRLLFMGRTRIAGIEPGALVRATGRVAEYKGHLALLNPRYELVAEYSEARG